MRILVAIDQSSYSEHTLAQVSHLAANTWADITILGVLPKKNKEVLESEFLETVSDYHKSFLETFDKVSSPYLEFSGEKDFSKVAPHTFERSYTDKNRHKELTVRVRMGNPAKIILEEAGEEGSDLILLGCDTDSCGWDAGGNVPYKVAMEASCSVLIIKKENNTKRILCCLDNDYVSQPSLEMVGQMANIYNADIDLVSITEKKVLKDNYQDRLDLLIKYYISQKIQPWIELVEISLFEKFVSQKNRWSLISMWVGKKSLFERIFPGSKVNRLLKNSETSVLLLR